MTARLKRTRHPGIYETGSSYIVRYRDASGRQRQKTCRTLDEAKRFRAKVTLNPAAGSPRSGPTVAEYADEWLSMLAGVRPATAVEYRRDLEAYVLPRLGGVRIGALDARRIRKLAYDLREEKTKRAPAGRSWATVRRILAPLSVMLGAASEDGVIPARPWPRLPTPRRDPLKRRHLSVDELARLLAALPTPQDRLLVRFLAETGVRVSELKALRWRDLELEDEPVVCVRRRHRLLDGEQETKSERSSGTVPITPQLARELKAHRLRNGQPDGGRLVFTGRAARGSTRPTTAAACLIPRACEHASFRSASTCCVTRMVRSWPQRPETFARFSDAFATHRRRSRWRRTFTFSTTGRVSTLSRMPLGPGPIDRAPE
jgi:integrase